MFRPTTDGGVPPYRRITENFIRLVSSGKLAPGTRVPSVRSLAAHIGVNPNTVLKAYNKLVKTGYLYSIRGRGHFIDHPPKSQRQKEVAELYGKLTETVNELLLRGESMSDVANFLTQTP